MAKIRVYELAKELQMENKALVDLVREMGIEVKSHSSSLTEEEVSLIKGHIQGTKSLVVEEQRIQSGVIRRRKKIVEVQPPPEAAQPVREPLPVEETPPSKPEPGVPSAFEPQAVQEAGVVPEQPVEALPKVPPQPVSEKKAVHKKIDEKEGLLPTAGEVKVKPVKPLKPPKEAAARVVRPAESPAKIIRPAETITKAGRPGEGPARGPQSAKTAAPPAKGEEKKTEKEALKEKIIPKRKGKTVKGAEEDATKAKVFKRKKEVLEREDLYEGPGKEGRAYRAIKGGKLTAKKFKKTEITTPKAIKRRLKIAEAINVNELARRLGIKGYRSDEKINCPGVDGDFEPIH